MKHRSTKTAKGASAQKAPSPWQPTRELQRAWFTSLTEEQQADQARRFGWQVSGLTYEQMSLKAYEWWESLTPEHRARPSSIKDPSAEDKARTEGFRAGRDSAVITLYISGTWTPADIADVFQDYELEEVKALCAEQDAA